MKKINLGQTVKSIFLFLLFVISAFGILCGVASFESLSVAIVPEAIDYESFSSRLLGISTVIFVFSAFSYLSGFLSLASVILVYIHSFISVFSFCVYYNYCDIASYVSVLIILIFAVCNFILIINCLHSCSFSFSCLRRSAGSSFSKDASGQIKKAILIIGCIAFAAFLSYIVFNFLVK